MFDREGVLYNKARQQEIEALRESAEKAKKDEYNESILEKEAKKTARESKIIEFCQYKENVKTTLLVEALARLCNLSTNDNDHCKAVCKNLMGQYVNENGTFALLGRMRKSKNAILMNIAEQVENYYKIITEDADMEDPESMVIEPEKVEDFWKNINDSNDIDDITNLIRIRVANAEEEFINKNQEDKENINNIIKDTSDRIEANATPDNEEYNTQIEAAETKFAKNKIYEIQHEGYRTTFDKMVHVLSETAVTNPEAGSAFTDNGKLNMEKIVESVRCMYAVLETVSTICLENVDAEFIKKTIESIRG